jgi:hypothetical protein
VYASFNLQPNYPRGGGHNYPNVWRAYWWIRDNLLTRYERVYYIATDAYVLSQRLMDWMEAVEAGQWTALWCHNHPEAQIQVITRGCKAFEDFFAGPCDPFKYNGLMEENTLPFTHVEKGFVGNRYGEIHPIRGYEPEMDYYTQVPDALDFDDEQFPVVRRVNGKIQVRRVSS